MLSFIFVAAGCPRLFGKISVFVLRQLHRLHHLAQHAVCKDHRGHAVFVGFIECVGNEVDHFLHRGRRENENLEVTVAEGFRRLPVIGL